jgi:hypothetical protein
MSCCAPSLPLLSLNLSVAILPKKVLDGPAVSAFRRAIAEVTQRWSVIGWVTKNLLSMLRNAH